ncbi:bidirectional sugar transporter SWEET14-like [Corylus avellana]|uniref:bidirectional sugar transporter SWEET14-like n=1 Tax=Corylus avellana TaxID=13451 RepID=UPI00286A9AC6|nr:bidirectional sugar transporter SWEET14-like [Corylus avellana]
MAFNHADQLSFVFGLLGTIVSFLVFLAPLPTFYRIYKKKSTEGFDSLPYSVALFSATLTFYYAFLKTNALMLIIINSIGFAIESIYLVVYMIYTPGRAKIYTAKLLILFNIGFLGLIILSTSLIIRESHLRLTAVGWICAIFSVCVYAAPLSVMKLVITTKSVEFMPLSLSFSLTICAIMWFFYGLLIKDFFVATPNILGFTFGTAQMILYIIYKDSKRQVVLPESMPQQDVPNGIQLSLTEMTMETVEPSESNV